MSEPNLPTLDYVTRTIKSLEELRDATSVDSPNWQAINSGIYICEVYKKMLPNYKPPIQTKAMPRPKTP